MPGDGEVVITQLLEMANYRDSKPIEPKKGMSPVMRFGAVVLGLTVVGIMFGSADTPETASKVQKSGTSSEQVKPSSIEVTPIIPDGWSKTNAKGVYWKWCDDVDNCDASNANGKYVMALVWCKEKACGDIYGRVNLINDAGVVNGWTNDTAYGDVGQKVQLTFDTYRDGWSKARLTELNIRG